MLISVPIGVDVVINGVVVTLNRTTREHAEVFVKVPPGTNITRESQTEFKVTKSS